jgi:uncharacterized membrane protein YvlD (DUF360 family)
MSHTSKNTENNSLVLPSNNTTLQTLIVNTTVPTLNNNTEKTNKICEWCIIIVITITILGIVGAAFAYIILAIMYLVQDYDIANECKDSSLWAYVLTAIVLALVRSNAKPKEQDNNICVFILLGLIECGLAIWGGIELWEKSCSDLIDTNLWEIGLVTFVLQVIFATVFLIIIPIVMCCIVFKDSKQYNTPSSPFDVV